MAVKKQVLGRGLGALIGDADIHLVGGAKYEIEIKDIELNPFQPRSKFDEESLKELASSIKELGIIQPVTVRTLPTGKYQLISGERRLKASILAGLKKIAAYVRTADDQAMLELALVENIQREDLNSIEVAISYQRLIEECKITQESLSVRVGKKRSTISNYLRLLKLPAEIQLGIKSKSITMGHARTLINITEPGIQLDMYKSIVDKGLSVRKLEDMVRSHMQKKSYSGKKVSTEIKLDENYQKLQAHLSKYFNADVILKRTSKGKGRIIIPFNSDDEMERIIGAFDKLNP